MVVAPLLSSSVIFVLSPFPTFEVHETLIVPDCLDSHVYAVTLTTSVAVGLTLTVTLAVLDLVLLDFKLTFTSKTKEVSAATPGATKVAVGDEALWMLIKGDAGEVLVQANARSLDKIPCAVLEPARKIVAPTRWTAAIGAAAATGSGELGLVGMGTSHVLDGVGGVGPGKGDRGPYCLPSRKSPWTRPRISENLDGGGSVPGMSTSGWIHSVTG